MSTSASPAAVHSRSLRIGLLLIAVCATIVVVGSGDRLRFDDEFRYQELANSLLQRHAYAAPDGTPTAWWPPGYPFAVSAVYALWHRPLAAKLLNVLCLTLAVYTAALLARRLYRNASSLTPYMALCYPIFLYVAGTLYPQLLGSLLFLCALALLSSDSLSRARAATAGLVYGLLCLTVPAFLLLLPLVLIYIALGTHASLRETLVKAGIVAAMTALTLSPWIVRNALQLHAFVPVSTNSGFNLLLGNSPLSQAQSKPDMALVCTEAHDSPDEVTYDHRLTHCATDWIKHNPMQAAHLYLSKVRNYFNYRDKLATTSEATDWAAWIMFATYYPLLLLAIARLAFIRRFPLNRTEVLLYLLYFGDALASALFFTRIRFRIPFDFLLVVIDSAFVARLWHQSRVGTLAPRLTTSA